MFEASGTNMKYHEKQTFIRFVLVYLSISFLLFISLAMLYYFDKKRDFENQLAVETSKYAQEYRDFEEADTPKGISIHLEKKGKLPYPAFIKDGETYKNTSCAGPIDRNKIIVVSVKKELVQKRLEKLQKRIIQGMLLLFAVNLVIGLILAYFALQPVRKANEQFLEFVDDVIHDLNAPVSALTINAQSLARECANSKIERILRSLESVQNIYKNLSVLLQERNKPEYKVIDLKESCDEVLKQLQTIYPKVVFELALPTLSIRVNPAAFERILTNLIENSVKYAKENPKIKIGLEDGRFFYIQDNGIGFEDADFLKSRYNQSKKSNKGFGLGLSIVKRLSEECGINLQVRSKVNEGTVFYFDITSLIVR